MFLFKILIANNDIIGVKCMCSDRRWLYEMFRQEHGIKFVAMVTSEDTKANVCSYSILNITENISFLHRIYSIC